MPEQGDDDYDIRIGETKLDLDVVKPRSGGGARVDVETADGRKWRVDVTSTGDMDSIVTTWRDGELADLEEPDWLEDILARLARAA